MQVCKLEELSERLHRLRDQLDTTSLIRSTPLDKGDKFVQAAMECEFMLPQKLTVGSLADKVNNKIENVKVLLERARKHEDLPDAAQTAAEQGYNVNEDDVSQKREQGSSGSIGSNISART